MNVLLPVTVYRALKDQIEKELATYEAGQERSKPMSHSSLKIM